MHNRTYAAEIAHAVSSRKRVEIIAKAKELGVTVSHEQDTVKKNIDDGLGHKLEGACYYRDLGVGMSMKKWGLNGMGWLQRYCGTEDSYSHILVPV